MTDVHQSHTPLPELPARLKRHLEGWANDFSYGYPRGAWREIDWFVRGRLIRHLGGAVRSRIAVGEASDGMSISSNLGWCC